jgi:hypothetical protein
MAEMQGRKKKKAGLTGIDGQATATKHAAIPHRQ